MASVGEPAADAGVAPHLASPLGRVAAVTAAAPLHERRDRLLPPLGAAAAVHARPAIVEHATVGAPTAVRKGGRPRGGRDHRPRKYGSPGRTARSPHIV
jgi:hypothetical protein